MGYKPISEWTPQQGDLLKWGNSSHTAIVESTRRTGDIVTIQISQYNAAARNKYSEATATFNARTHTFTRSYPTFDVPSRWFR
jgi:hypothetical protein